MKDIRLMATRGLVAKAWLAARSLGRRLALSAGRMAALFWVSFRGIWRKLWAALRYGWQVFLLLLVLLGALPAWLAYSFRADIDWSPPLDPGDALTTPFEIKNTGLFTVREVRFTCKIHSAEFAWGAEVTASEFGEARVISLLEPDDAVTVYCARDVLTSELPMPKADIEIVLEFYPQSVPFLEKAGAARWLDRTPRSLRYQMSRDRFGNIRWSRRGLAE